MQISELWWLLALLGSCLTGVIIYINQVFKMPSSLLMIYRGCVVALLLLPFIPFFTPPTDPIFWILAAIQGLVVAYSDKRMFLCSRIYVGEIVGSLRPFSVAMIFVVWWVVSPIQLIEMLKEPVQFCMIVLCMVGITYSLIIANTGKVTKEAFKELLPALILFAIIDINNKYINTLGSRVGINSAAFYYCIITGVFAGLPNVVKFFRHRDWRLIFAPRYVIGGLLMSLSIIATNFLKAPAMIYAPNPAYVSAIIAAFPVWIVAWNSIYYRLKGAEEFPHCNFKAVLLLLISIVTLILLQ